MEEELGKVLPLRNGTEIVAKRGLTILGALRGLLEHERPHFDTLLAIAQGRKEGIDPHSIEYLKDLGYLSTECEIDEKTRDVLRSSYQETPEGPVLVNPFRFANRDDAQRVEDAKEEHLQKFIRALNERRKADEGRSPP